ncbi:uncharacterized protein LOC132087870 [Daphnia carinata]|uniref:uncharacterized protein LOC132087870 n=1 Tax=Daphnia carinata TaxID=120202 RepID=UPI002868F2E7|nr:uncharacterized protein LOC132087870 [Daphnia carinata]
MEFRLGSCRLHVSHFKLCEHGNIFALWFLKVFLLLSVSKLGQQETKSSFSPHRRLHLCLFAFAFAFVFAYSPLRLRLRLFASPPSPIRLSAFAYSPLRLRLFASPPSPIRLSAFASSPSSLLRRLRRLRLFAVFASSPSSPLRRLRLFASSPLRLRLFAVFAVFAFVSSPSPHHRLRLRLITVFAFASSPSSHCLVAAYVFTSSPSFACDQQRWNSRIQEKTHSDRT